MPRKSLADEAAEFAARYTGDGVEGGVERAEERLAYVAYVAYESAYETVIGRARRARKRGLGPERERAYFGGVAAVAGERSGTGDEP